ncbi:MAG: hypothetical protein WDW38_003651 [Sanguina aurantia]
MKAGMNLAEVISAVPQLGISCSTVLTDGTSGSGVKLLRLVSKQLRASMLGVLQGYTLQLNGSGAGLEDQMGLLQHARLSRLLVVVTDDANGRQWGGNEQPEASPCCRSLLTCTTLTSLDFYDSMPTPDVWRELPPGLRDLRCMLSATPPESLVFGNLRSLQCNCGPAANCVLLEDIAAVLRMAPKLEVLNLVSGEASLESMLERPFAPAIEG